MAPKESFRRWSVLVIMIGMSACTTTVGGGPGTAIPSSCMQDQNVVGCVGSSTGYSCTGTDTPDEDSTSDLNCSSGTPSNGGLTLFCCINDSAVTSGCSVDSSIVGCSGSSIGFSCTGDANPMTSDSSLVCSTGTPNGSSTAFCCATYVPSSGTCAQDATVTGCVSPSIGFSCSGTDTPATVNPSLSCSMGTPGGAGTQYCCGPMSTPTPTPTATCAVDPVVTCTSPSTGYSCTGGTNPTATDPTLSCGQGAMEADGSSFAFCCNTMMSMPTPTAGCMADPSVMGCPGDSTGYTCTGGANPMTATLLCGNAMPGANGAQSFCCTTS